MYSIGSKALFKKMCAIILAFIMMVMPTIAKPVDVNALEISPKYESAILIKNIFSIDTKGMASMKTAVSPMPNNMPDRIMVRMIISKIDGTITYNKTHQAEWNDMTERYEVEKTFQLNRRGNYQLRTTIYCYKSGELIETIQCAPKKQTY